MHAVNKMNALLRPRFITKYGTKQGVLVLGKQIPLGLGVGVGAVTNHLVGRAIVKTAKKIFGPPPEEFAPEREPVVEAVWDRGDEQDELV